MQTDDSPPAAEVAEQAEDELDEVIIEGRRQKPIRSPQKIFNWMARVVGQYTVEGVVDLRGKSRTQDMRTVTGQARSAAGDVVETTRSRTAALTVLSMVGGGSLHPHGYGAASPPELGCRR